MMGMRQDMQQRISRARVNDNNLRDKISRARSLIYEKNYAVTSGLVDVILKEESLVPTDVRHFQFVTHQLYLYAILPEYVFIQTREFQFQFVLDARG
jgi:hypothetical protein